MPYKTPQMDTSSSQGRLPLGIGLMLLASAVGIMAGFGSWIIKVSIVHMASLFLSWMRDDGGINWYIGALPFAGIFLAVAYQRFVVHASLEHGSDQVRRDLQERRFYMRRGLCYQPFIASILTLGFGGSAGAEGPCATVGAALGSNLSRKLGMAPEIVRVMMGCGAGAGIAGIFKAPVAGMMFTLEVMKVRIGTMSVMALTLASLCGALTCYALTGFSFDIRFMPSAFFDWRTSGWVIALGVFCGLYSVYYNRVAAMLGKFFNRIGNVWFRAAAGSAMAGIALLLFPCMYGEGYGTITALVNGNDAGILAGSLWAGHDGDVWLLVSLASAIMLLKVFATIASNSSGGVAGDFAPTVFAGAFAGFVFARCVSALFGVELPVGLFCLYGAAGAFAGIIHAPLMAIFLAAGIVGNGYGFILPLAMVSLTSYLVMKLLTPASRYAGADHDDLAALLGTPPIPMYNDKDNNKRPGSR